MNKFRFPLAQSFGARIRVAAPDQGLYLVTGRASQPQALIQQMGGQIVLPIPQSFKLLALLPGAAFLALRHHPDIQHIGPVSLDPVRFNRFLELAGLDRLEQEVPNNNNGG